VGDAPPREGAVALRKGISARVLERVYRARATWFSACGLGSATTGPAQSRCGPICPVPSRC